MQVDLFFIRWDGSVFKNLIGGQTRSHQYLVSEIKEAKEGVRQFVALFPHHEAQVKSVTAKLHLFYLQRR